MNKSDLNKLKVAIVYDRVNKWGGAERVLLTLHEIFPNAPLFTSVYDKHSTPWAKVFPKIYASFLQKIPFVRIHHELFGWLMPLAFESFNFSKYDLVISVTSEAAKGIITGPNTVHVCYCLTPTRYLWSHEDEYFKNKLLKLISSPLVMYLKYWDKVASNRPDEIIAISTEVQKRIKKYYKRESEIVFPPVENTSHHKNRLLRVSRSTYGKTSRQFSLDAKYFLCVGRLVPYKKVDLLIDTFNKLNLPLVIVGSGSQSENLKRKANRNIKFAGFVDESELGGFYHNATALIMPQEEDFGLVAIEAQAYGVPVIAYAKGGSLDTVVDEKTGVLFNTQSTASLIQAIAKFEKIVFNHSYIRRYAKRFNKSRFKRQLQRSLIRAYSGWRRRDSTVAQIS